jgi:hypothetical protein
MTTWAEHDAGLLTVFCAVAQPVGLLRRLVAHAKQIEAIELDAALRTVSADDFQASSSASACPSCVALRWHSALWPRRISAALLAPTFDLRAALAPQLIVCCDSC